MRAILRPPEVYHAVQARKRSTTTLVAMRIQLLLGQHVAAALHATRQLAMFSATRGHPLPSPHRSRRQRRTSQLKDTILSGTQLSDQVVQMMAVIWRCPRRERPAVRSCLRMQMQRGGSKHGMLLSQRGIFRPRTSSMIDARTQPLTLGSSRQSTPTPHKSRNSRPHLHHHILASSQQHPIFGLHA